MSKDPQVIWKEFQKLKLSGKKKKKRNNPGPDELLFPGVTPRDLSILMYKPCFQAIGLSKIRRVGLKTHLWFSRVNVTEGACC